MREGKLEYETGEWMRAASVVVWSKRNAFDLDEGYK